MDIVLYCLAIVIAAVITGLLGYFMVPFLHKIKFGQTCLLYTSDAADD